MCAWSASQVKPSQNKPMEFTMANTITVLGINGRIGREIAQAFVSSGWQVTGFGRTDRAKLRGVRFVAGDAQNCDDIKRAIKGADVVVNALNLAYDKWENGRAEALLAKVLEAVKGRGITLMFPGNIYNYAVGQHLIEPHTPQKPEREKGHIRVRMENMLKAASRAGDIKTIVVRTGDFYAPGAVGSSFDLAFMSRLKSNVLQYLGDLSVGHTWAYLPDVARAYVRLAEERDGMKSFENFHFAGHFVTGHKLMGAIQSVLARPARVALVPWPMMTVIGWFAPVVRELVKMRYLFQEPHRLADPRLDAILGDDFSTPFDEAVGRTALSYLPDNKKRPATGTAPVTG
jgi:nucleoside-diphosphate-sugar epimerase